MKAQLNLLKVILFFLLALISYLPFSYAETAVVESDSAIPQPVLTSINPIVELNDELSELNRRQEESTGEERLALQLQMFQRNEDLRSLIATEIKDDKADQTFLLKQVQQQQMFSLAGTEYLTKRVTLLAEKINDAKDEEKFALLGEYGEVQDYLDKMYQDQWQNLGWLESLGQQVTTAYDTLKQSFSRRADLLAANLEYLRQQLNADAAQLKVAPESEKAPIQLRQLIHQRRLEVTSRSLHEMIALADKVGLPTADFKRLYFEVTGSVTQDLLSVEVILVILKSWTTDFGEWLVENAPQHLFQLLVVVIILLIARLIAKLTRKVVRRTVSSKKIKLSMLMQEFFVSMSGRVVWFIGFLIALSQLGLNLAPILTGFGIAGVIIGFALQDTLSNFAAGMMLLIYRPFDVGDFVAAGGVEGKVSHMSLVNTTIRTFDNQIIIVPNSKIWGDVIKNVTHERVRRVDMVFGVGYSDNIPQVEEVLHDIITTHPAVLKAPEPVIKLHVLNSSSVDFIVRPWVKTDDYWDVYWDVTREVKMRFDQEGISIPFPQQDVHLHMVGNQPIPPE